MHEGLYLIERIHFLQINGNVITDYLLECQLLSVFVSAEADNIISNEI